MDFSLESFASFLGGSLVGWFTDSQTAARTIEVGGMKLDLHRLASFSVLRGVQCSFGGEDWILRTKNEKADYISRLTDFDDWQITQDFFLSLSDLRESDGYSTLRVDV